MPDPGRQTATFLLTDIEESTRSWEADAAAMRTALRRHDRLLRSGIHEHGGRVLTSRGEGDSFFAVFASARDAVGAACGIQLQLASEPWPEGIGIRVRMALNTGEAEADLRGPAINRCARLRSAAHGGQVLLTQATADLCDRLPALASLVPMGQHRLRDLAEPVDIFELRHPALRTRFPPLRTLSAYSQNLPTQLTSFIGRERELAELRELLRTSRLLTLSGVGGSGKTRLALQLAAEMLDDYPDGVWFVDLSALREPGLVPQALASALSVREAEGKDLLDEVAGHMAADRCRLHCLVILDNCEHLVDPCAMAAERLLSRCSQLTVLTTSREPLHVAGEVIWRVPPLGQGAPEVAPGREASDEVLLFLDRARMAQPGFQADEADRAHIAEICARLDGLPLAIELAAARVGVMSLQSLLGQLVSRIPLAGRRSSVERQRTLEAAIGWSHGLLTERERILFGRLGVFSGGFSIEAVEAVCSDGPGSALEVLSSLIDKSLVQPIPGLERHRLLDTVRDFALSRLGEAGERDQVAGRHFAHFADLARGASAEVLGPRQAEWLRRLHEDHDNLRAALEFGLAERRAGDTLSLVLGLNRFWSVRGHLGEGRGWMEATLELATEPSVERARTRNYCAGFAWALGDYHGARSHLEASLEDWRLLEDSAGIQPCLANLGVIASSQGDFAAARSYYEESLALARERDDPRAVVSLLSNLGLAEAELGNLELADRHVRDALELVRPVGDRALEANSRINLAIVCLAMGRLDEALRHYVESLTTLRELADTRNLAVCLEGLAMVAAEQRVYVRTMRLAGAAAGLRQAIGAQPTPTARRRLEPRLQRAREALGSLDAGDLWESGMKLTGEEAIRAALEFAPAP